MVTGGQGAGKTTFVIELVNSLQTNGLKLAGFYANGFWKDNKRSHFEITNIEDSNNMVLCSAHHKKDWVKRASYWFNPEAIKYGNNILKEAINNRPDIIVIDEVGKLELEGYIWHRAIQRIIELTDFPMIWTVRNNILKKAVSFFGLNNVVIFDIEKLTIKAAAENIMMI